jgi:hypothetical protein
MNFSVTDLHFYRIFGIKIDVKLEVRVFYNIHKIKFKFKLSLEVVIECKNINRDVLKLMFSIYSLATNCYLKIERKILFYYIESVITALLLQL